MWRQLERIEIAGAESLFSLPPEQSPDTGYVD